MSSVYVNGSNSFTLELKKIYFIFDENFTLNLVLCVAPAFTCGANSTYDPCMSACPASCANLAAPLDCDKTYCMEGCKCVEGFVFSEGSCVPYNECGCDYLGRYYPVR